jgi:hypothetical protein
MFYIFVPNIFLSKAKLKEGVFVGPDIRKLMKDEVFEFKMEEIEKKILRNPLKKLSRIFSVIIKA